jgi:transporter family protein
VAVAFLRERVNFVQVGGVLMALVAIFLFNGTDASGAVDTSIWQTSLAAPWMAGALFALALYGVQGIALKLSTNHISDELATICYFVGSAIVTFLVLATQPIDWSMPVETWILAVGSGVAMGLALLIGFAAYRGGSASVVTALLALYPIVTVLLAIVFLGDQMTIVKALAIGIAVTAGLALAHEGRSGRKEETVPSGIDLTKNEAVSARNQ